MIMPFRLDEGIYFEDTGKTLMWGEKIEKLKNIDNPEVVSDGEVLRWFNKSCFDGQLVNITIVVDEYHNAKNYLDFVNVEQGDDPWVVYEKYSGLFKQHLGNPTETADDGYGRPTELWTIGDLQIIIGVGERFVEYEIFGIHKGKPFWKLK